MAIIVNMPRLSDTMEEGTVASWLKKVGDKIEEGDILAEIETDKATMEFESFNEGTLLHIGVQEGETTMVDELLAIIGDEGEDISALLNPTAAVEETTTEETEAPVEAAAAVVETSNSKHSRRCDCGDYAALKRHHGRRDCCELAQTSWGCDRRRRYFS